MVARKTTRKVSGKPAAHPLNLLPAPGTALTIVGIGASAGGLEALEATLREALAMAQSRFIEQGDRGEEVRVLEGILRQAQSIFEAGVAQVALPGDVGSRARAGAPKP